jgi:hypothetical protein
MRWFTLAICGLLLAVSPAQASPLQITQITVTGAPAIDAAGATIAVTGNASADTSGPLPVVSIPQTGILIDLAGNVLIEHAGSGLSLGLPGLLAPVLVNDFVIDLDADQLFASVIAPGVSATPFAVTDILSNGDLALSSEAAALLATIGLTGLSGFVWGSVSFAPLPVPAPASLALMLVGLAGLAALRRQPALAALRRQTAIT